MTDDLLAALALVLVLEGLTPFLSPSGFKRTMQTISQVPDDKLRLIGLAAMSAGLGLLYLVR